MRKNPFAHFTQCPVNYVVFLFSLVEIVTILHLVWAWGIVSYTLVVSFPDCKYSSHIAVLIKTAENLISLCSSFLKDSVLYTLVSFVSCPQLILLKSFTLVTSPCVEAWKLYPDSRVENIELSFFVYHISGMANIKNFKNCYFMYFFPVFRSCFR